MDFAASDVGVEDDEGDDSVAKLQAKLRRGSSELDRKAALQLFEMIQDDKDAIFPSEIVVRDTKTSLEARSALVAARDELGVKPGAEVHVAVPRAWAVVKSLTLPDVGPEELPQLLRFQAAKAIPVPRDFFLA